MNFIACLKCTNSSNEKSLIAGGILYVNCVLNLTEKYSYFDVNNKEYVITRRDTPIPFVE